MEQQLRIDKVASKMDVTTKTIYEWIRCGKFPKGTLIGERTRVWSESELKNWLDSRKGTIA